MDYLSFRFKNQLITGFFCSLLAITTSVLSYQNPDLQPPLFKAPAFCPVAQPCKVIIVIPAYNEEKRITKTLLTYFDYFRTCPNITATFLVVCNNCSDSTAAICKNLQKDHPELQYMDLKPGGKGFAIKQGFLKALESQDVDYIGFVDADMATTPPYFYDLIVNMQNHDGVVASRYKTGARVWPNRPFVKKIGGKFYNWVLRKNFHLDILDTQCGAKLFTYDTIKKAAPHMQEIGWAWDLEFLYLCQLYDKDIIEIPTTWIDAPGSHLTISGCYKEFITSPVRIKNNHKLLAAQLSHKKSKAKHKKHFHNSQSAATN